MSGSQQPPHTPPEVPPPSRPPLPNWPVPDAPHPPPATAPGTRMPVVLEPFAATLEERLLAHRVVTVTGRIDAQTATDAAARLLHLDALAATPVTVRLDSPGGDVGACLVLVDTFGEMRAPVHVVVVGQAAGAVVAVLAAAAERSIYPHARILLTEPDLPAVEGDAAHVRTEAAAQQRLVDAAYDVIAARCGRSRAEVAADATRRRMLTAEEALAYRLVDRVQGGAGGAAG